jgi:hypothetical protein
MVQSIIFRIIAIALIIFAIAIAFIEKSPFYLLAGISAAAIIYELAILIHKNKKD